MGIPPFFLHLINPSHKKFKEHIEAIQSKNTTDKKGVTGADYGVSGSVFTSRQTLLMLLEDECR